MRDKLGTWDEHTDTTIFLLFNWSVMSYSPATPWTVALQAPLFMGFPKQEYWSGLPFPSPRDLPDQGLNLDPALAGRSFNTEPPGKPTLLYLYHR